MKQAGRLLADRARRGEMSEKALRFAGAHRGATRRTIATLTRFIDQPKNRRFIFSASVWCVN